MPGERRSELGASRILALSALCDRRLGDSYLVRAAGLYGWGIATSYGIGIVIDPSSALSILDRALVTLVWVPGAVIALAAARDGGGALEASGVAGLSRQRGLTSRALAWARFFGTSLRIGRAIAIRSVLLSLFAASRATEATGTLAPVRWVVGACLVSLVAGVGLSALSRGAALILPERGRLLLVALVLLPLSVSLIWPGSPNLLDIVRDLVPGLLGSGGA